MPELVYCISDHTVKEILIVDEKGVRGQLEDVFVSLRLHLSKKYSLVMRE